MFGGPFNRLPFNRPADFTRTIYGGGIVNAQVEVLGSFLREMRSGGTVEVPVEVLASFIRQMMGVPVEVDITVEIQGSFTREFKLGGTPVDVYVEVLGEGYRNHFDTITFTGSFAPGEVIVIDAKMLTFTKNQQNALQDMTGDFFDLNLGGNEITYIDSQGSRNVLMRITHRDKFV